MFTQSQPTQKLSEDSDEDLKPYTENKCNSLKFPSDDPIVKPGVPAFDFRQARWPRACARSVRERVHERNKRLLFCGVQIQGVGQNGQEYAPESKLITCSMIVEVNHLVERPVNPIMHIRRGERGISDGWDLK